MCCGSGNRAARPDRAALSGFIEAVVYPFRGDTADVLWNWPWAPAQPRLPADRRGAHWEGGISGQRRGSGGLAAPGRSPRQTRRQKDTDLRVRRLLTRARGGTETDLVEFGAKFGHPKIFVSLIEWADKVITE